MTSAPFPGGPGIRDPRRIPGRDSREGRHGWNAPSRGMQVVRRLLVACVALACLVSVERGVQLASLSLASDARETVGLHVSRESDAFGRLKSSPSSGCVAEGLKVAVCFYGLNRALRHTLESIEASVLRPMADECAEVDVFYHTWSLVELTDTGTSGGTREAVARHGARPSGAESE